MKKASHGGLTVGLVYLLRFDEGFYLKIQLTWLLPLQVGAVQVGLAPWVPLAWVLL